MHALALALSATGRVPFSPVGLFGASDNGAYFSLANVTTAYANSSRTTLARPDESVKGLTDLSGKGSHATISSSDSTCRLERDVTSGAWYIRQSQQASAKRLTATFSGSLGSSCTVVFANHTSVEIKTGQTIGTTYEIPKSFVRAVFIINRALTADETTQLRTFFSQLCIAYRSSYTYYASATGNDANDGLTSGTPKTIAGGVTQLLAGASGSWLAIVGGGTSTDAIDTGSTAVAKTLNIVFLSPTVMDKSETPGVGSSSAWGANANSLTLNLYGEGNLTVQNYGNNGVGSANSCILNVYDVHATGNYDNFTGHGTSTMRRYRCTADNGGKSAMADTGTAATYYSEACVWYAKIGSVLGGGLFGEKGCAADYVYNDFLPDPAMTTSMAHFLWVRTQASTGAGATCTVRKSRFGAPHIAIPATPPAVSACFNTTFTDCYFNGGFFQPDTAPSDMQFVRPFGPKFTLRPRRTSTATWGVNRGVLKGGTISSHIIDGAVYSAGTDTFGTGVVQNTLFEGANPAVYAVSNTTEFNAAVSLLNNGFWSNTANYTAGITADGTDVTSDPSLGPANTDVQADWCVTAAAYIGAGVSGGNIGFASADITTGVPTNTVAPTLSGPLTNGQTQTTTNGTWTGSPTSYAYKWQSATDGSGTGVADIAAQTSSTLVLGAGQVGKYVRGGVLAHNSIDNAAAYAFSSWVGPIADVLAISGTPATTGSVGSAYSFTPSASGGHTTYVFSIVNKPSWASFNTSTGALTGTPSGAETDSGIVITVTDADGLTASLASFTITVSNYSAEALAAFAAMSVQPSTAEKGVYDAMIVSLKSAGVWAKLDAIYALGVHDASAALINLKAPGTYDLTTSGSPSFSAGSGYTGNGSSAYLNSNFSPTTATSPNFTQNSQCQFAWSLKSGQDAGALAGQLATSNNYIYGRFTDNTAYGKANHTADMSVASTDGSGLWHVNRSAVNATQFYKNGSSVATGTGASLTLGSSNLGFLRSQADFFAGGLAFAGFGGSLSSSDASALYSALNTFKTNWT